MTLLTALLFSSVSWGKLSIENTKPLEIPVNQYDEKITNADVQKVIPANLEATNDASKVATKIADHSLTNWFNSPAVQGSLLGHTAATVQDKMHADVVVKTSDEPEAIQHKFSMQFQALQAIAKFQYTGWLNAVFNYDARAAQTVVEFSEKVFNKDMFLNHTSSSKEGISTVGIKWGW